MINLTGQCMIRLSHWTPEYDFHDVAVGNYNWIRMSNRPLHYWNYDYIMAVLRPLGDLIYVQKREHISLQHLRAFTRLKSPIIFPMEVVVDVSVWSLKVLLEDYGVLVLRSKIVQAPKKTANSFYDIPFRAANSQSIPPLSQQPAIPAPSV